MPSSCSFLTVRKSESHRRFWYTQISFPVLVEMSTSCWASVDVGTKGFSTRTCFPASRAAFVKAKWVSGVVVMMMMSREGSAISSLAEW